jgi:DHA2 family multidrug resistance protein
MQSGFLQIPGAVAAGVTMVMMGKVAGRYDSRMLVAMGALVTVGAAVMLSTINPGTGVHSLFWPLIWRSVGSVMMFLPLSLATVGSLPKDKIASGSGFYNLTRQLGSSIGIAVITTLLVHREATHRAVLVERVSLSQPAAVARLNLFSAAFLRRSSNPVLARRLAFKAVSSSVDGQAALKAYADIFLYVGAAFTLTLPLLLFLDKGKNKAAPSVH